MGACPGHNITKKHVTGRNTRTKLIQEYLPGNSLHQSTHYSNSSDNLEDALHPKTPIQLSLDRGPTSLPSGRRHFILPWYLRQGQCLEVFPRLLFLLVLEDLGIGTAPRQMQCLGSPHCTASHLVSPQMNCFAYPGGAWKCVTLHPSCGCTRNTTLSMMLRSGAKKTP